MLKSFVWQSSAFGTSHTTCRARVVNEARITSSMGRWLYSAVVGLLVMNSAVTAKANEITRGSVFDLSLEELIAMRVYTASRELTSIEEAPSVVTVITAEEIRRRGYRSLKEALDRVPGFFNTPDQSLPLIANRGYIQNPHNNYLLLIDGHAINSVADEGIGNTHMLPFLYQVKRIEVIRGPGSTLWGGDAANGIIHLITYDGKDLAEKGEVFTKVTADYEFSRPRHIVNALLATQLGEEGDLMVSLTQTDNQADFLPIESATATGLAPYRFPYKHEAHRPSYELHTKANWRDVRLTARSARVGTYYRWDTESRSDEVRDYDFDYVELGYFPQLTDNLSLETDVYYNRIDNPWRLYTPGGTIAGGFRTEGWDSSYTENGINAILTYRGFEHHRLKAGTQWKRRDFDGQYFLDPEGEGGGGHFETPVGTENALGVFLEETYSGIEDWLFTLGLRHQENDFRQAGSDLLWRGASIWSFNDRWTFKYMYNSGVVPAALTRTRGTLEDPLILPDGTAQVGPHSPQLSFAHDLQALYTDNDTRASITLFKQTLEEFVSRTEPFDTGNALPDGTPIVVRETNVGDLEAYGLELEGSHRLNDCWLLYGNYAWAVNKINETSGSVPGLPGATFDLVAESKGLFTEDGQTTGVPEHIWNLGFDWSFASRFALNLHYRGWAGNWAKVSTVPEFASYGPEHYLDLNLSCRDFYTEGMELQVYVKNIFDNRSPLAQGAHNGIIEGLGSQVGVSVSCLF